jgi:hypothetical protein
VSNTGAAVLHAIQRLSLICVCSNEKNISTNSNHISKKFKDPTMPKTFKSNLNNNKFNNNDHDDNDEEEPLKLSIIMIKDSNKTVTINNQILREQDQIDGYQIIKIEPNKVLLQNLNTNTDSKLYSNFKNLLSNNKNPDLNNNQGKFIELSLPKIIIKEPIDK